jgi:AraC family transcriptional regulator of adaptative response/methylated-DNA-[protein]-cysteine methyltransferase
MAQSDAAAAQTEMVEEVCRFLEAHADEPPTLTVLARRVNLSPGHLQRVFRRITGVTPRAYADACRLGRLKARLREGRTVTTALYEAGYGSSSRLYEGATQRLGMTPGDYKRGGPGQRIGYTVADSPLGRLLLAATPRGVCALRLGEKDADLERELRREFPAAELVRDDDHLKEYVEAVRRLMNGARPLTELPLDVQATAFQRRVWEELCAIPVGQTRSYSQVARRIGRPKAARAVARACATNPVAVIVPCHRVIREDGSLGGYGFGLDRKRTLLERERQASEEMQE